MNKLVLLASLAVAASASAVDLKDPDQVLRDWDNTVALTREPVASAETLADQSTRLQTHRQPDLAPRVVAPRLAPRTPFPPLKTPPNEPPRGAKPWRYRDQTFWIVPLSGESRADN